MCSLCFLRFCICLPSTVNYGVKLMVKVFSLSALQSPCAEPPPYLAHAPANIAPALHHPGPGTTAREHPVAQSPSTLLKPVHPPQLLPWPCLAFSAANTAESPAGLLPLLLLLPLDQIRQPCVACLLPPLGRFK